MYNGALAVNWRGWRDRMAERRGTDLATLKYLASHWMLAVFGLVILVMGAWLLISSI